MAIAVFGGTGQVGRALVDELSARGEEAWVLSRSADDPTPLPAGARSVVADLDDPDGLRPALDGADAVFLLVPNGPTETHRALNALSVVIDAAPDRIVYLSSDLARRAPLVAHAGAKLGVEAALAACGIDHTILRPTYFAQNDLVVRHALLAGTYPVPIGRAPVARVDVRDVATAAATALVDGGATERAVLISGPDQPDAEETAALWAEALGRPVVWSGTRAEEWSAAAAATMPSWMVLDLTTMFRHLERHGQPVTMEDLEPQRELLPTPLRYRDFVEETARHWSGEAVG